MKRVWGVAVTLIFGSALIGFFIGFALDRKEAALIELPRLDGAGPFRLPQGMAGDTALLHLFSVRERDGADSPSSEREQRLLTALASAGTFSIYGVAVGEQREPLIDQPRPYRVLAWDRKGQLLRLLEIDSLPTTLLYAPDGTLLGRHRGALSIEAVEQRLIPLTIDYFSAQ